MEPFENPFFPLLMIIAFILTIIKILIGVLGYLGEAIARLIGAYTTVIANRINTVDFVPSIRRRYGLVSFILAFAAILPAEIVWINLGGQANVFLWDKIPFLFVYWGLVAVGAVVTGIMVGFIELANHRI